MTIQAREIVPPRPNLGPEPWVDQPAWPVLLGPSLAAVGLVAILGLAWTRMRRRRARPIAEVAGELSGGAEISPRLRMIVASDSVRVALIAAYGPTWGSKTTEEIAADPGLSERLDPARAEGLVAFLRLADRAKFAGDEPAGADAALAWAAEFAAGLAASRPTASTRRGRATSGRR